MSTSIPQAGYSELKVVAAFENASRESMPYDVVETKIGDTVAYTADRDLGLTRLMLKIPLNLMEIFTDGWAWQSRHTINSDQGEQS